MTPALLALSRAYLALPLAPRRDSHALMQCDTDRNNGYRDVAGLRWVWDAEWSEYRLLDLTDAATGGVMLARLGDAVGIVEIGPDRIGLRYDSDCPTLGEGATLAEAVARAAVAVGRAG